MHSPLLFWFLATLLVMVTLGTLLAALLRRHDVAGGPGLEAASVELFRDQKRQLDAELAAGTLTPAEHADQVTELSTRLGHEIAAPEPGPAPMQRAPWIAALALTALVPLVSAGLYLALGNPAAITAVAQPPATAAAANQPDRDQINKMVETLAERMKANPEDPRGWTLLGRSYAALGRFDDAAHAYAQASQRAPNDAGIYADWADALGMSQGQSLMGKPTELIEKALALEPTNRKALALAGSAAMDRRDYPAALRYWNTLAANVAPGSEEAKEVAGAIADVQRAQAAGGNAMAGASGVPGAPSASANVSASAASAMAQGATPGSPVSGAVTATTASTPTKATLRGRVQLSPALAAQAKPDDIVFIYARATQGPRMPLAIIRTTVRDLPKDFVLDDSLSMAPGMTLSAFPQVMVEARVAKGGSAIPASGDLAGQAGPLSSTSANVNIVIDRVLP